MRDTPSDGDVKKTKPPTAARVLLDERLIDEPAGLHQADDHQTRPLAFLPFLLDHDSTSSQERMGHYQPPPPEPKSVEAELEAAADNSTVRRGVGSN